MALFSHLQTCTIPKEQTSFPKEASSLRRTKNGVTTRSFLQDEKTNSSRPFHISMSHSIHFRLNLALLFRRCSETETLETNFDSRHIPKHEIKKHRQTSKRYNQQRNDDHETNPRNESNGSQFEPQ
mmetsp:Transcript_5322/g.7802  ORF Transcript_5322/g.7802 Transcript_5322/m.7802 type:complete len:126 (-) Transcript_5322:1408-1785(-)